MGWLFQYDVFISYTRADRRFVEELAEDLRRAGFNVFYDQWCLKPGGLWLSQIHAALKSCGAGVVVLSPDAIASPAVWMEFTALLTRAWKQQRPLIPILYREVEDLGVFGALQYIDFRDSRPDARAEAFAKLVKTLNGTPPGPSWPPPIPPIWRRPRVSLRLTLLFVLLLALVVPSIGSMISFLRSQRTIKSLRRIQNELQQIDHRITSEETIRPKIQDQNTVRYFDPDKGDHIATDIWVNGRWAWREFYRNGRLVARDEILYHDQEIIEKIRSYFDDEQRVFLEDYFTNDGMLIKKRDCPSGPESSCSVRVDVMRSPVLPPVFPFAYP